MWEPNTDPSTGGSAYSYNDGSSYPDTKEGMGRIHVTGANVLAVGGSTRFMSYADYLAEVYHNAKGDPTKGKGLLYWNPNRADGHGNDE
jgi:hypothetical protein